VFDEPIPLPSGRKLVTLKDAADYVTKLPKVEQDKVEWQTAIHCLIGAARPGLPDASSDRDGAGAERRQAS
jgi:hypothetical protein